MNKKVKIKRTLTFSELNIGDVFLYDNVLFIKIDQFDTDDHDIKNAVLLILNNKKTFLFLENLIIIQL